MFTRSGPGANRLQGPCATPSGTSTRCNFSRRASGDCGMTSRTSAARNAAMSALTANSRSRDSSETADGGAGGAAAVIPLKCRFARRGGVWQLCRLCGQRHAVPQLEINFVAPLHQRKIFIVSVDPAEELLAVPRLVRPRAPQEIVDARACL